VSWRPGNIDADPLFAESYHLKSLGGRWQSVESWVVDDVHSPCIDAGDPESDYSKESEPNGGRVNMGAYGNTPQASRSGYKLSVSSTPIQGITVSGDQPGTTPYSR